ncbi:MAG: hypothetical protein HBSAPP04_01410 [Ignavibacteriaceae bacterium]|nr:MAG: hypothetical protein HBSAPP04_01410 [Ignavibacteriaceae bacterium]
MFISPERLQIQEFRNKIGKRAGNIFSYFVIDEVHCVSEWGHDFRTSYLRLGENGRKYFLTNNVDNPSIAFIGLTATASLDVLADVQRELTLGESTIVKASGMEREELEFSVVKVDNEGTKAMHLEKLLSDPSDEALKGNGIIFCLTRKNNETSVEKLFNRLSVSNPIKKFGKFTGSSTTVEQTQQKHDDLNSQNQEDFLNNKLDVLIATKAFGMGIDKPDIRFTVHVNFPNSIESFYQEAGRAGRDKEAAKCKILFSGDPSESDTLYYFFNSSFKGEKKEKAIVEDMLSEFLILQEAPIDRLKNEIAEILDGAEIEFVFKDNSPKFIIYADHFIDTPLVYDIRSKSFENLQKVAKEDEVVFKLKQKLVDFTITVRDPLVSIQNRPLSTAPGLEAALADLQVGEFLAKDVYYGFENSKEEVLSKDLLRHGLNIPPQDIREYYNDSINHLKFTNKILNKFAKIGSLKHKPQIEQVCNDGYLEIRSEVDTFKGVYRMSLLGLIDDYEVDYNKKMVRVTRIQKKSDEEYVERLHDYMCKYVSREKANQIISTILEPGEKSIIRSCLDALIVFTYDEIAKKRRQGIESMREACRIGISIGSHDFREYLKLYFESKYYNDLHSATEGAKLTDLQIVNEFIARTDGKIAELKHLRGACLRLLQENPDNYAIRFLKDLTNLLLETKDVEFLNDTQKSIATTLLSLLDQDKFDLPSLEELLIQFRDRITNYNSQLFETLEMIRGMLQLHHLSGFLFNLNNKILG